MIISSHAVRRDPGKARGSWKPLFPVSVYTPLKGLFGAFHTADTHAISIRQKQ